MRKSGRCKPKSSQLHSYDKESLFLFVYKCKCIATVHTKDNSKYTPLSIADHDPSGALGQGRWWRK